MKGNIKKLVVGILLLLAIAFGIRVYSIKTLEKKIITNVDSVGKDVKYNINDANSILTYTGVWGSGNLKSREYDLTIFSSDFEKVPNGSKYHFINSFDGIEGDTFIHVQVVSNEDTYDISKYPDKVLNKNGEVFYVLERGEKEKITPTAPRNKLEIQDGWKWTKDGNYTYITGRVKNMTDTNITYFKLTAEYLDSSGNILDTDYTNSGETIRPGAMKEFEIMHKYSDEYDKVRLIVEEVNN